MAFDTIFAFEQDFSGELQCIPMAVRYKLDLCGVKLSLRQWSHFTQEDRRALVVCEYGSAVEIAQFRSTLTALISNRAGEGTKFLPVEASPAWSDPDAVPDQIIAYSKTLGIEPPTLTQWRSLSVLQRFTLSKLSRDSHDNVNFVPALEEFELRPAQRA
jgi:hypothetical protein